MLSELSIESILKRNKIKETIMNMEGMLIIAIILIILSLVLDITKGNISETKYGKTKDISYNKSPVSFIFKIAFRIILLLIFIFALIKK